MTSPKTVSESYERRATEYLEPDQEHYIPEKYQLGILNEYLENRGVQYVTEGKVLSYPIDILGVDGTDTIAIEMKSRNLGRGIDQAARDADLVDHSYLAVWDHSVSDTLQNRVEERDIGLMSIGESVSIISEPSVRSQQLLPKDEIVGIVKSDVRDDSSI